MKRLVQLKEPNKMASPDQSYSLVAGDCDFVGGDLVFESPFGEITIPEKDYGPFLNLSDELDLAEFGQSRPDVLVVNYG